MFIIVHIHFILTVPVGSLLFCEEINILFSNIFWRIKQSIYSKPQLISKLFPLYLFPTPFRSRNLINVDIWLHKILYMTKTTNHLSSSSSNLLIRPKFQLLKISEIHLTKCFSWSWPCREMCFSVMIRKAFDDNVSSSRPEICCISSISVLQG